MTASSRPLELEFRGDDVERLVVVGDDLRFLQDLPRDRLATHTEVRLAAGILRRLLIERNLEDLWARSTGKEKITLSVSATDLDAALNATAEELVWYAWAGGALSGTSAGHAGFIAAILKKADYDEFGPEAFMKSGKYGQPETASMDLRAWLRSTAMAAMSLTRFPGQFASRDHAAGAVA